MSAANYEDVLQQLMEADLLPATVKGERGGYYIGGLVVNSASPVRCNTTDDAHEQRGWYRLWTIDLPDANKNLETWITGAFGVNRGADHGTQTVKINRGDRPSLTAAESQAIRERQAAQAKQAKAMRAAQAKEAAQKADAKWRSYVPEGESAYLKRKGVQAYGLRFAPNGLDEVLVPMTRGGRVVGLQILRGADRGSLREKDYWPYGMDKIGAYHLIGGMPRGLVLVTEGYATGASIHEATGLPVAVAFDAGQLKNVTAELLKAYRGSKILICADDDYLTPGNPGVEAARLAATAHGAEWVKPEFAEERSTTKKGPTDFNDLHALEGLHVVREQVAARLAALGWSAAPARASAPKGGGDAQDLPRAVSVMDMGDAIARFVPIDDDKGEALFDNWTNTIVQKKKMTNILAAGIRFDDVKRDPEWIERGSFYLHEIGFDPSGKDKNVRLNTWRGWPLQPEAGKCDAIIDLIRFLCSSEKKNSAVFEWLLAWMAYPLQNPGAKMPSAVIMHGLQGTGKSMVFKALSRIYGNGHPYRDYSVILDQKALQDNFNADWENKLFVLAEEVVNSSDKWQLKNELKELISGDRLRIRKVFTDAYRQKNQINMVFLSNEHQPLPLDNDDRRHCVIWTPPPASGDFYDAVLDEIANGGVAAFYQYLLDLDISAFRPGDRPPMTESKARLIGLAQTSEVRFINDYLAGEIGRPVVPCLSADFYAAYLEWCRHNGERHPRASNHFWGTVERMPGWKKYKQRVFEDLHCLGATVPRNVVVPPLAALQAAGTAKPDGTETDAWVTEGYIEFQNAAKNKEGKQWAA